MRRPLAIFLFAGVSLTAACHGGKDEASCTVMGDAATATISCPDGTSVTVGNRPGDTPQLQRDGGGTLDTADSSAAEPTDAQAPPDSETSAPTDAGIAAPTDAETDEPLSIVQLEEEPPGVNCNAGGVKITTGLDIDEDGSLDAPGEVQSSSFVCSGDLCPTLEGNLTIRNIQDWQNLVAAGCSTITGELTILVPGVVTLTPPANKLAEVGSLDIPSNPTLTSLTLPALTKVHGTVGISQNVVLESLNFPVLTTTDGFIEASNNPALTDLGLPALASMPNMGEAMTILDNRSLTALSLPSLTTLGGTIQVIFQVISNTALSSISLEALTTMSGGLIVSRSNALTSLSLPVLATAGTLSIDQVGIASLSLPMLATVTEELNIQRTRSLTALSAPVLTNVKTLTIRGNSALPSLDLPLLATVGDRMYVDGNASLTTLDLPALTTVNAELIITDNFMLKQCLAEALHDQLTTEPSYYSVTGNAVGTCP
jgi:hypothetical protein